MNIIVYGRKARIIGVNPLIVGTDHLWPRGRLGDIAGIEVYVQLLNNELEHFKVTLDNRKRSAAEFVLDLEELASGRARELLAVKKARDAEGRKHAAVQAELDGLIAKIDAA